MFKKWDIIFITRFPDTIQCSNLRCRRSFSITKYFCPHCNKENSVSNIIGKARPIILWLDQTFWSQSMAFGIPLSKAKFYSDKVNEGIKLSDYQFLHKNPVYNVPMRAIICQATRIDGNVLSSNRIIGKITSSVSKRSIENKLLDWIFAEY